MKNLLALALMILFFSSTLCAQNWSIGLHGIVDQGLKEYKDNVANVGQGLAISGLYSIPNSKFSVGMDFGIAMYYQNTNIEDLTERGYSGVNAEVYEEDCYYTYNAFARYHIAEYGPVSSYAEVKIGGATYFTDKLYDNFSDGSAAEFIEDEYIVHGTSFKTGIGAGLLLNLGMLRNVPTKGKFTIDAGLTVNNGSKTNYRSVNNSRNVNISTSDSDRFSKTNNIIYRFGLFYTF